MTSHYELLSIIPLKYTEKKVPIIIDGITNIIKECDGTITHEGECTKRKMAYPIKQVRHGFFIAHEFELDTKNLKKFQTDLVSMPEILRFQITERKPGAYEPTHISNKEKSQKFEPSPAKSEISKTAQEKSLVWSEPSDLKSPEELRVPRPILEPQTAKPKDDRGKRPKINLEDLDKKLDKILQEEI